MNSQKKYRFERKFIIPDAEVQELKQMVLHHPMMFSEIFYRRDVNNIYFDTMDLSNYHQNVSGNSQRIKVRVRWYGELFGEVINPVLELKIRSGQLGKKMSFPLISFNVDRNLSYEYLFESLFKKSNLPADILEILKTLRPILLSSYSRQYFLSSDKKYRITIDNNLVFYKINPKNNTFSEKMIDRHTVILELKYDSNEDNLVSKVTSAFPFRLTASSKYVYGLDLLDF